MTAGFHTVIFAFRLARELGTRHDTYMDLFLVQDFVIAQQFIALKIKKPSQMNGKAFCGPDGTRTRLA
jgi:sulfur relay (sulfurtransferase) complex TusBCD TusD component (DsrE family)